MQDIEKQFDLEIRSILSDAEESVSPGVWSAVSAGLDAAAAAVARRARIVRMRRWAGAVAGVAAAIAGIFILLPDNTSNLINNQNSFAVVRMPELITPDLTPAGEIRLAQRTAPPKTQKTAEEETYVPKSIEEAVQQTEAREAEPVRNTESAQQAKPAPEKAIDSAQDVSALNRLAFEEKHKTKAAGPAAFSAGGKIGNNNLATQPVAGPRRAKASAPSETGITEINSQSNFGIPVSLGIQAKIGISSQWEIGTGLEYSLLTRKFVGTYTDVEAGTPSVTTDIFNTQHYLGIPITLYYNILQSKSVRFYSLVGGMGEINLANNYSIQTDPVTHFSKRYDKCQFSMTMGIGTEFSLGEHIGIYFDPSVRYYFKSGQPRSIRTQQPLMMTLDVGVRLNL